MTLLCLLTPPPLLRLFDPWDTPFDSLQDSSNLVFDLRAAAFLGVAVMALIDTAAYEGPAPEVALRQIFVNSGVGEKDRVAIGKNGFTTVDLIANLADDLPAFHSAITTLFGDDMGAGAAKLIKLATLATMWRQCKALVSMKVDQASKLHEDPNRIPEIAMMEYGAYRDAFTVRHPETVLTDWKEPNKRFLERLIRDLAIHQVVPPYELGEVRLRSETIIQSSGVAASADLLLKVARVDEPVSVTCEEDAIHRIHALLVSLEYVGQLAYGDFKGARGSRTGGSLSYLRELEHRRRETPGLRFIVAVDRKIRKKVHQLMVEKRLEFGTYSEALFEVLDRHEIYWTEARLDTRVESPVKRRKAKSPAKRKRRSLSPSNSHERRGRPTKRKRDTRKTEKTTSERKQTRSQRSQSPRRRVADAIKPEIKGAKVPEEEWQKLKKEGSPRVSGTCRFYNHSCGCTRENCSFKQLCWVCGGQHRWIDRHFTNRTV